MSTQMSTDSRTAAVQQPGPKPLLAGLFADQMARLGLSTATQRHTGAMPTVLIDPARATGALAAELRGVIVQLNGAEVWGPFESARSTGDGFFEIVLGDRTVRTEAQDRLAVSGSAYAEAGGKPVVQYAAAPVADRAYAGGAMDVAFEARDDAGATAPLRASVLEDGSHRR
ncbi:hypothetical protein Bequi_13760 [Brachybacterium sp. JHP9]|uniref:Htaa domain-containing protein n=1 Tax=Brachybacterium equifaecis TaxID=2910770 RepID=A0ABT0R3H6_9MICO|nr:hypothetical protein [Brachybacterium equifaecis]MCL6424431.1 hypothetical protein [Brachybacterium equifaecis]